MVNKSLLEDISNRLTELCEKHGVACNLAVESLYDNGCIVRIPRDIANERNDALVEICEELKSLSGISAIWDHGRDSVIRGDDYRQFEISVSDGHWTHTDADVKAEREIMREYFDDDFRKKKEAERQAHRVEHWEDYLIPLPKRDNNPNTELYLTMSYEPYDWIDKGYYEDGKHLYKTTEFRAYSDYYAKKLLSHPIKTVKFQRGYGGPGRGKPAQMRFEVESITLWDPTQRIECDPFNPKKGIVPQFFAINLGKRLQ